MMKQAMPEIISDIPKKSGSMIKSCDKKYLIRKLREMKRFTFLVYLLLISAFLNPLLAQYEENPLPQHLTEEEKGRLDEIGRDFFITDPPEGNVRAIAEYEPMESVLIRYPLGIPLDLVATFSEEILVATIVSGTDQENNATDDFISAGVNMDNVKFIHAPTDSFWTRDYGPWYVEYGDQQIGIINFPYNRLRPNDDDIPIVIADSLGLELFGMDMVHTGGNYMASGGAQAASTTLVYEENGHTPEELDQLALDYLGVEQYHFNEDPLDDYIEHIDTWGKFLDVDKILIGQVPEDDYRYEDFEAVANYYENTLSDWGTPYQVFRVFTPGDAPSTPYTNSLILNDRVFVPTTGSQWDDEALATFEDVMPGYDIIGVDFYSWQNTDALHCRTHEMADDEMLKIKHTPLLGDIDSREEYIIEAEIIPFSGEALYGDSVKVYYRFNAEGSYSYNVMENTTGNFYEAGIPVPEEATEVYYYIHAADESGRSENHPYIGAYDPHDFYPTPTNVAEIQLDAETLEATAMVDLTAEESLQISNEGEVDLNFTIDFTFNEGDGWAYALTQTGVVNPGSSVDISVIFDAAGLSVDTYTGLMSIASNVPLHPVVEVPLTFDVTINTAASTLEEKGVTIHPNPFRKQLVIDFAGLSGKNLKFRIYNIQGELVKTFNGPDIHALQKIRWDGRNNNGDVVPGGIYLIEVTGDSGRIIRKVSKQ
jgi:agmatine/peptidylarginine deiminase